MCLCLIQSTFCRSANMYRKILHKLLQQKKTNIIDFVSIDLFLYPHYCLFHLAWKNVLITFGQKFLRLDLFNKFETSWKNNGKFTYRRFLENLKVIHNIPLKHRRTTSEIPNHRPTSGRDDLLEKGSLFSWSENETRIQSR